MGVSLFDFIPYPEELSLTSTKFSRIAVLWGPKDSTNALTLVLDIWLPKKVMFFVGLEAEIKPVSLSADPIMYPRSCKTETTEPNAISLEVGKVQWNNPQVRRQFKFITALGGIL